MKADSTWTLTTADFQTAQVELAAIDDGGALVSTGGAQRRVKWDDLLILDRQTETKPAPGKFVISLAGGDRVRGGPVKLDGETLMWKAPSVGDIAIPLRQVVSITRAAQSTAPAENQTEDVITLTNGDSVRGILSDIAADRVTINAAGTVMPVPLDSVASVHLASTAAPPAVSQRAIRVRLSDDSIFTATAVRIDGEKLALSLPGAGGAGGSREVPLAAVAGIEQINGPVSWLSSRQPSENLHTPFLQTSRPAKMDRTVTGKPIRFGDRTYSRGIGVAPYSKITWALDGAYSSFRTQYTIDAPAAYADVTVRVLLDGKPVHERKSFTAGELSPVVVVPLGKSKSLTLEVDFGGNYNVQDRFAWIEPALLKTNPTPTTRP